MEPGYRKLVLENHIDAVNKNTLSLEGFFDFLFGKKKEEKPVKTIPELIEKIKNGKCTIHTNHKDFKEYIKCLEDLEGNVLDSIERNIKRVSEFLNFFIHQKENVIKNQDKVIKLGKYTYKVHIVKGYPVFKTDFYLADVGIRNSNDHIEDTDELDEDILELLKIPTHLEDLDFFIGISHNSKDKQELTIGENEKEILIKTLEKLDHTLTRLQPECSKLQELFITTEKSFIDTLKKLGAPSEVYKDEYVGFGGSMHQGLGYLYEVNRGFVEDIIKEIK